jgi:mannose-6-phosphate isomerase-like protein (cupin superfamily)
MDIQSTLKVIEPATVQSGPGVIEGQKLQRIIGCPDSIPTDRLRLAIATYKPGAIEPLHWHPIEAAYFILSGHAIVRDINGKEYHVGPGTTIYAPAGLAGSHEWEVKEALQILSIRGTPEAVRKLQFTVDKETKRSYIDVDELAKRGGLSFESHY